MNHTAVLVGGWRDGTHIEVDDHAVRRGFVVLPEVDPGGLTATEVRYRLDAGGASGALRFVRETP